MNDPLMKYFNDVYTKPYTRLTPYLIGISIGYQMHNERAVNPIQERSLVPMFSDLFIFKVTHFFTFLTNFGNVLWIVMKNIISTKVCDLE